MSGDILENVGQLLFDEESTDTDTFTYGKLKLSPAKKSGKAAMLLADAIFNSGLVMAEMIELDAVEVDGRKILELGSGCGLPSLYAAKMKRPKFVLVTDYPDDEILGPLRKNVENAGIERCQVLGYKWGDNVEQLLSFGKFDLILLSDILWLENEHENVIKTCEGTLEQLSSAKIYITCGDYTKKHVLEHFVRLATKFQIKEIVGPLHGISPERWLSKEHTSLTNLDERKRRVWVLEMSWSKEYIH